MIFDMTLQLMTFHLLVQLRVASAGQAELVS
jgi:hypothetical protein